MRELVTAGHGTRGIGFKYGKMKGLKISPPQSVARIDHTSFLCANEASPVSPSAYPSTIRSLSYSPSSLLPSPPSRRPTHSASAELPHRPFTLSSVSGRFAQHAILQVTHPPRARCTCVLSRRFAGAALWKRGIYEIPVKTLLSGLSGRLRRVTGVLERANVSAPVRRMTLRRPTGGFA